MNSLEQYLKPPTNNKEEEIYNEEGDRGGEENEYIQNQENGNDNGENINFTPNQKDKEDIQNSKNMNILKNNLEYEDENNDIIQGINSLNNIGNKDVNINLNLNKEENNNYDFEDNNNININTQKEKIEYDYNNHNFLNINETTNNEGNSQDELMNDLLLKIRKIKENRAKNSNKFENEKNKFNNTNYTNNNNNIDDLINTGIKKNKNEYIGKLNINNQIFQNNPKMKELANLLKEYNQDNNKNDKLQINYDNNNQINIIKPDIFFNNHNNLKNNNIDYYDKNIQRKYYISAIDGKAIVNGQRVDVNSGFQMAQNNLKNKILDFNEINSFNSNNKNTLFDFNNNNLFHKRNKSNSTNKIWSTGNNLDFQLNNLKLTNNNENQFKIKNENDIKIDFKKTQKNNFLSKDYYNDELDKIKNSLFNIDKNLNKLKK